MSGEFWPWWWGGVAVGAIATLCPLLSGRALGVSSFYAQLFEKRSEPELDLAALEDAMLAETEAEFGPSAVSETAVQDKLGRLRVESERFRPLFLLGMVLGPLAYLTVTGRWAISFSLGAGFDLRYGERGWLPAIVLLGSGVLIGFGTRLAGGCTSGHGISGVARGARSSLLTTAVFWCTALLVAWCFTWAQR